MMICINCHSKLLNVRESHFFSHIQYDVCDKCGGIWLDKGELDKLACQTPGSVEFSSVDLVHQDPRNLSGVYSYLTPHCLRCSDQRMSKMHFMGETRILLDYCEKCGGLWLDGGELTKINQFIQWFDKKAKPSKFGRFLRHAQSSFFHRIDVNIEFGAEKVHQ